MNNLESGPVLVKEEERVVLKELSSVLELLNIDKVTVQCNNQSAVWSHVSETLQAALECCSNCLDGF